MKISKTLLVAALSGIAGCMIGALVVSRYWARLTTDLISSSGGAEAVQLVHNLQLLRQGNTQEAINLMEIELDGNILTLGTQAKGMGPKAKEVENHLQKIAAYRKQSSYVTANSEIKTKIEQTLSTSNQ